MENVNPDAVAPAITTPAFASLNSVRSPLGVVPAVVTSSDRYEQKADDTKPLIKVLLVGAGAVGKTALIHRLRYGEFSAATVPTMGLHLEIIEMDFDRFTVRVLLNDSSGPSSCGPITKAQIGLADAVLYCYDVDSPTSFVVATTLFNPTKAGMLVGLQSDKAVSEDAGNRARLSTQAPRMAEGLGIGHAEMSAKASSQEELMAVLRQLIAPIARAKKEAVAGRKFVELTL